MHGVYDNIGDIFGIGSNVQDFELENQFGTSLCQSQSNLAMKRKLEYGDHELVVKRKIQNAVKNG